MRRFGAAGLLSLLVLAGCATAAEAELGTVVEGIATPEEFVRATVTDVRATDELLVELSDGDVTLWVAGFVERPNRGAEVWTAILAPPVENDLVGLVYPSAGLLLPPEEGITEAGALAVLVGILAVVALVIPAVSSAVLGNRSSRRCGNCGTGVEAGWISCPSCATALAEDSDRRPPPGATIISTKPDVAEEIGALPVEPLQEIEIEEPDSAPVADPGPAAGTRIFRREE